MLIVFKYFFGSHPIVAVGLSNVKHNLNLAHGEYEEVLSTLHMQCTQSKVEKYRQIMPIPDRVNFYLAQWASAMNAPCSEGDEKCLTQEYSEYPRLKEHTFYMTQAFPNNATTDMNLCVDYTTWYDGVFRVSWNGVQQFFGAGDAFYNYAKEMVRSMDWAGWKRDAQGSDTEHTYMIAASFGDSFADINMPLLRKTRRAGAQDSTVIFKMESWRHWIGAQETIAEDTAAWTEKKSVAVWRGASTGLLYPTKYYDLPDEDPNAASYSSRAHLIRRIPQWKKSSKLDIGVNFYTQDVPALWGISSTMTKHDQMTHKMIIIAEGNDVATGMKWALSSTSAVIMTKPVKSSWLMEELLEEWVHYIPVNQDWSDLEEKVQWCLDNDEKCRHIGLGGRCWMHQFFYAEREKEVQSTVLRRTAEQQKKLHLCQCNLNKAEPVNVWRCKV